MGYTIASEFVPVKNRYGEVCHVKRYSIKEDEE
jgi:hypothetical protein